MSEPAEPLWKRLFYVQASIQDVMGAPRVRVEAGLQVGPRLHLFAEAEPQGKHVGVGGGIRWVF